MAIDRFAGLRTDVPLERFVGESGELAADLARATNVLVDDAAAIRRRDGTTLRVAGAASSLFAAAGRCVFVAGDALMELLPDFTTRTLARGLTPGAPMRYLEMNERLYFANGHESGVIDGTRVRPWGIEPPGPLTLADAEGELHAGVYHVTATWIASDGQESGALPPTRVDVEGGGIAVTGIARPTRPDIEYLVLYASTAGGETLYEARVLAAGVASVTITDSEAAIPLESMNLCPAPPGAHLVASYLGHALLAVDRVLYHSEAFGPERFDALDYLDLGARITMIVPLERGFYVSTTEATGYVSGATPEEWRYTELARHGAIEGSEARIQTHLLKFDGVAEGEAALWLTARGVHVGLDGGVLYNLTDPRYRPSLEAVRAAGVVRELDGSTYYLATLQ